MGYAKIKNLYQQTDILMLKEVFCLEKIHGSSSWLNYSGSKGLTFYAGGVGQSEFEALFNKNELLEKFKELYDEFPITVYGEVYGGKCQKMSETYGKSLRFVAFEVKFNDKWLSVPQAEDVVKKLGLEFVFYTKTSTELEALNFERDRDSEQGIRNGMGNHPSEGIVIRPLIELTKNNGERLIAKYKKENFRETKSPRPVNEEKLAILKCAEAIAEEWVTVERLHHVVDKLGVGIEIEPTNIPTIIRSMLEDVRREAEGEIEWSKEADRAIGKATAQMVKDICQHSLGS